MPTSSTFSNSNTLETDGSTFPRQPSAHLTSSIQPPRPYRSTKPPKNWSGSQIGGPSSSSASPYGPISSTSRSCVSLNSSHPIWTTELQQLHMWAWLLTFMLWLSQLRPARNNSMNWREPLTTTSITSGEWMSIRSRMSMPTWWLRTSRIIPMGRDIFKMLSYENA